jgi:hypothetical protein
MAPMDDPGQHSDIIVLLVQEHRVLDGDGAKGHGILYGIALFIHDDDHVVIIRDGFYSDWLDLHAGDLWIGFCNVLLGTFDDDLHCQTRRTVGFQVSVRRTKRMFATLTFEPQETDLFMTHVTPGIHGIHGEKKVFTYGTMWTILTIAFLIFIGAMLFALDFLIFECGKEGCDKTRSKTRRLVALIALSIAFVLYVYHRFVVAKPDMKRIARINLNGV